MAVIQTSLHGKRIGLSKDNELIIDGRLVTPAAPADLWALAPVFGADPSVAYMLFDDFIYGASSTVSDTMAWTSAGDAGTGTNAFQDAAGGVFNLVTAAAQDDYHELTSTSENWKFAAGKALWFEARFKLAEATTNDATWWFGLTDTLTTGGMQTGASGPLATYDGALVYKLQDALTVDFETSNAGTQVTTAAFGTSISDTWHRAGFYFDGTATTSTIKPYFHNGTSWATATAHSITLSGLEEMHVVAGVKAGPGGAAETLQIDYIKCVQLR